MRYLLVNEQGVVLKESPRSKYMDLVNQSDLKYLDISDIQEPNKNFLCTLVNKDRCYMLKVNKVPDGFKLIANLNDVSWAAYHAICMFEIKSQIVQVADTFPANSAPQNLLFKLLAALERIFKRSA